MGPSAFGLMALVANLLQLIETNPIHREVPENPTVALEVIVVNNNPLPVHARSGNDQHDRSENNQVPGRVLEPAQEKEPENHGGDADSEQQGDEPAGKRINGAIAVHGLLNHAAGRPASGFEVPVGRQEKQRTDDHAELPVAHGLIPKRRLTVDIYSNL